jgi:hypothetical protein
MSDGLSEPECLYYQKPIENGGFEPLLLTKVPTFQSKKALKT